MLGLVVIALFAAYLAVSGLVVWLAARWARKRNRRPWVWGGLAALVMYNLVFWDWIPTLVMHKYYCATQAGFWVYKTPEQWAKENPGVLETLKPWPASKLYGPDKVRVMLAGGEYDGFNDRFGYWQKQSRNLNGLLVHKNQESIMDGKTKETIATRIYFSSGQGNFWKFWLNRGSCNDEQQVKTAKSMSVIASQLHMHEQEN